MNNELKLYTAFSSGLQIDLSIINDELKYQSIPQWDSIGHMVLVNEIEEAFDVTFDTDEVIDMSSVSVAKEILRKHNINI